MNWKEGDCEKRGGKENESIFLTSSGTDQFQEGAELEAIYACVFCKILCCIPGYDSPFVPSVTVNLNFGATEIVVCQLADESKFGVNNNTLTEDFLPSCLCT